MCLWFRWSDSSYFSISFSMSLTGLIASLYFSLGTIQTVSLFVTISFLSLSFVFLPLYSLPLSPYSKQAFFSNWFMLLISLNRLLLQRTNKDFCFSLLQGTNRGFHYCKGFFFFFVFLVYLIGWKTLVRSMCIWRCNEELQVWVWILIGKYGLGFRVCTFFFFWWISGLVFL